MPQCVDGCILGLVNSSAVDICISDVFVSCHTSEFVLELRQKLCCSADDGSTAVEVALKMAFRAFMQQNQLDPGKPTEGHGPVELQVVGLANAYHGDTLGAMDCVPPSPFNGPAQAPWYRGRGLFFEPPYVAMEKGSWQVVQPTPPWWSDMGAQGLWASPKWSSLHDVLSPARDGSDLAGAYRRHIEQQLDEHVRKQASPSDPQRPQGQLAALVVEPLLQGAGGMLMVDPQFQRELVAVGHLMLALAVADKVTSLHKKRVLAVA
ncbi:hypothetical protein DUNSADRAFT_5588 [Dunaliella salina]|uniref:Uncharacterized protein n=1 Tax=Dunaliella salina TaxID=3046 RepID=A0ABQ7FU82_DUNSA|nr:hypothetical protein DUNSADRAFT_5588 [Dunaliella salina]|eukprot:KAF5825977.1 hypothetical protein DUNSADRAFT_5588 [Dunaliella salina]